MKKIYKRITALILICAVIIGSVFGMDCVSCAETGSGSDSAAADEKIQGKSVFGYSNADRFVADALLGQAKDENGTPMEFSNFASSPIITKFVYKTIAEGIIDKEWLAAGAVFWKTAEDCLNADFYDMATWKKLMYENLILEWLAYQFESDEFESEYQKCSAKYAWNITNEIVKEDDASGAAGLSKMSVKSAKKALKNKSNKFLNKVKTIPGFMEVVSDLDKVAVTGLDYYKKVTKVLAAGEVSCGRIDYLKQVREVTSDKDLKDAIDVVIKKFEKSLVEKLLLEAENIMLKTVCDQTWDLIVGGVKGISSTASASLSLIKLGQEGLDWLFNTDNTSTAQVQMVILYTVNSDFTAVYQKIKDDYVNNPNDEKASLFNSSFYSYVSYQAYASNVIKTFVGQSLLDGAWNQIVNLFSHANLQTYENLSDMIDGNIGICKGWSSLAGRYYNLYLNKIKNSISWYSESTDYSATFDIPDDCVEYQGHCYYLYDTDEVYNYEQAVRYCQDRNGYLATITSQEENTFLFDYIKKKGYSSAYFGMSDYEEQGFWKWCNGEAAYYTNWSDRQPYYEGDNPVSDGWDYALFSENNADGTWCTGDFTSISGSGRAVFLCEWGEYSCEPDETENKEVLSTERDIVLALDVSGSMGGDPLEQTKLASFNFVETILGKEANIGVVTYAGSADRQSELSVNKTRLEGAVSNLSESGDTNIGAGLEEAYSMLKAGKAKKKIMVLMSDGEPNEGKTEDELIRYAETIKQEGILIYTLGFFSQLSDTKYSAQMLMEKIASEGCHYEVEDAGDLVFFFEDIADQISGQKYIYVRVACPVEVSVEYNGQKLDSSEENQNLRTDFGTLTFEEADENEEGTDDTEEEDNRVKVLRLKEGVEYDLKVKGTGRGTMNYTVGFMDDNGEYYDFRKFENIAIKRRTVIDTVVKKSEESILNIDGDGDGTYDLVLAAGANGYGQEVKRIPLVIIAAFVAGAAVIVISIVLIAVKRRRKRKKEVKG